MSYQINFEVGDIVYSPYYNYTGIVKELKTANGQDYLILHDPTKPAEHVCATTIRIDSASSLKPIYVQMVCKKEDYEQAAKSLYFPKPL